MKKVCTKCKEEKQLSEFRKAKNHPLGYNYRCKSCMKVINEKYKDQKIKTDAIYREANREKLRESYKLHYHNNKATIQEKAALRKKDLFKDENEKIKYLQKRREVVKRSYEKNKLLKPPKEKRPSRALTSKMRYQLNKEKILLECRNRYKKDPTRKINNARAYLAANRLEINKKVAENRRLRMVTDPIFKLKHVCRGRITSSLKRKGYSKKSYTHQLLGCSYEVAKKHIERKFKKGMDWNNHGKVWEIDHIIPLSSAKTEDELIILFHYRNIQPLFSHENRSKSSKILSSQTYINI